MKPANKSRRTERKRFGRAAAKRASKLRRCRAGRAHRKNIPGACHAPSRCRIRVQPFVPDARDKARPAGFLAAAAVRVDAREKGARRLARVLLEFFL